MRQLVHVEIVDGLRGMKRSSSCVGNKQISPLSTMSSTGLDLVLGLNHVRCFAVEF
jgi:hypothetical protein